MIAKFEKQHYGATVAKILETDDSIVEVQERNDGCYGLIVHHRREDRDAWDDLTAYLKPEHFDALGSVARRMRGEPECCKGAAPISECQCARDKTDIPTNGPLPVFTKESLVEWADKIDARLGPIAVRDADALARLLRATASYIGLLQKDRADGDIALRDAIRETAVTADELAFWRYQAIWGRAYLLQPSAIKQPFMEESAVWKEAIRQLEAARELENRERTAGVDPLSEPQS